MGIVVIEPIVEVPQKRRVQRLAQHPTKSRCPANISKNDRKKGEQGLLVRLGFPETLHPLKKGVTSVVSAGPVAIPLPGRALGFTTVLQTQSSWLLRQNCPCPRCWLIRVQHMAD